MPKNKGNRRKLQIHPTFKPVSIDAVKVKLLKEDERGKFYLLSNMENSRHLKVHESIYNVIKMFNGENTIADIERQLCELGNPFDLSKLINLLAEEGFIKNLKHFQKQKSSDIFSFKIKIFNLDSDDMAKLCKIFSFVKSPIFRWFYVLFCGIGFFFFLYNIQDIFSVSLEIGKLETSIFPLLLSMPIFYLVEIAHEIAHAGTYHFYGGISSSVGLEFHFLIPFFYTDTLDARQMDVRKNIFIFLSGPLTSLFFAQTFTYLYLLNGAWRELWAINALFWHISTLITMSPIIRTDGYFIMQAVLKFPNLIQHGTANFVKIMQLLFRRISLSEYRDHLSQYSVSERRILKVYTLTFLVGVSILTYLYVFLVIQLGIIDLLLLTPKILTGMAPNIKAYVLWILSIYSIIFSFIGIVAAVTKAFKHHV